jgi:hypothetical protein
MAITRCATSRSTFATSIYNTCNIPLKHLKHTLATCSFHPTSNDATQSGGTANWNSRFWKSASWPPSSVAVAGVSRPARGVSATRSRMHHYWRLSPREVADRAPWRGSREGQLVAAPSASCCQRGTEASGGTMQNGNHTHQSVSMMERKEVARRRSRVVGREDEGKRVTRRNEVHRAE